VFFYAVVEYLYAQERTVIQAISESVAVKMLKMKLLASPLDSLYAVSDA